MGKVSDREQTTGAGMDLDYGYGDGFRVWIWIMNENSDESRYNLLSFLFYFIFVIRSCLPFWHRRPNIYLAPQTDKDVMCLFV